MQPAIASGPGSGPESPFAVGDPLFGPRLVLDEVQLAATLNQAEEYADLRSNAPWIDPWHWLPRKAARFPLRNSYRIIRLLLKPQRLYNVTVVNVVRYFARGIIRAVRTQGESLRRLEDDLTRRVADLEREVRRLR